MVTRPFKRFKKGDYVRFTSAHDDQMFRERYRVPQEFRVHYADDDGTYVWHNPGRGCYSFRLELCEGPW